MDSSEALDDHVPWKNHASIRLLPTSDALTARADAGMASQATGFKSEDRVRAPAHLFRT